MPRPYRVLALLIAAQAVVQSVAAGFFAGSLYLWIVTDGAEGVGDRSALRALPGEGPVMALDRMVLDSAERWLSGGTALTVHRITELWVAPILAVALLTAPRAWRRTAPVAGAVGLQWLTGLAAGTVPVAAALHELAAFAVFVTALAAAGLVRRRPATLAALVGAAVVASAMALAAAAVGVAAYVTDSRAVVYSTIVERVAGAGYPVHMLLALAVIPLLALVSRRAVVVLAALAYGALAVLAEYSPWAAAGLQLTGFVVLAAVLWPSPGAGRASGSPAAP
ncbi:hypothetical protein KZZ52_13495 [Dactylosporangium sp. AC04546]|uniref:hypothetical protein n=1 Tax=Dactylosporangium sp. AC04546 TaxID=2862460 RepID=UPI001EDD1B04|nr:hypothetical protein [Dactylosporangium sp. AC04546]WVK86341.1 hypothetical protein KZZ52_13495 [Dactylosporangium sp. AC04546]